jgi:hypothetical protein
LLDRLARTFGCDSKPHLVARGEPRNHLTDGIGRRLSIDRHHAEATDECGRSSI